MKVTVFESDYYEPREEKIEVNTLEELKEIMKKYNYRLAVIEFLSESMSNLVNFDAIITLNYNINEE